MKQRPFVLSVAGFDPSGGAGILADIKTFESYKTSGLAVSTGLTFQTEDQFLGVEWHAEGLIKKQLEPLIKRYPIEYVKIGLIENMERLANIVELLRLSNPKIKIIWDPILQTSTGFSIHENLKTSELEKIAEEVFMITPNLDEIEAFYPDLSSLDSAEHLSKYCKVFLKGGHDEQNKGRDKLIERGKTQSFKPIKVSRYSKHGTGCIVSAAILAGLARGYPLNKAILKAKRYITKILLSNKTMLGYHS